MSLTSLTSSSPLVAKEDIICYKLGYNRDNKRFISPYMYYIYRFNTPAYSSLYIEGSEKYWSVYRGIHTFVSLRDAIIFKENHFPPRYYDLSIFKCVIPKGSKYYLGKYGDFNNYASNALIPIGKITAKDIFKAKCKGIIDKILWFVYIS